MEKNQAGSSVRVNMNFPKDIHQKIKELANKDHRSFTSYIVKVLADNIKESEQQS